MKQQMLTVEFRETEVSLGSHDPFRGGEELAGLERTRGVFLRETPGGKLKVAAVVR
jgi:hypothetical protein